MLSFSLVLGFLWTLWSARLAFLGSDAVGGSGPVATLRTKDENASIYFATDVEIHGDGCWHWRISVRPVSTVEENEGGSPDLRYTTTRKTAITVYNGHSVSLLVKIRSGYVDCDQLIRGSEKEATTKLKLKYCKRLPMFCTG